MKLKYIKLAENFLDAHYKEKTQPIDTRWSAVLNFAQWLDENDTKGEVWHVLPTGDLKEHNETGLNCWCNPKVQEQENGAYIVVHNSLDGRELKEQKKKSN